MVGDTNMPWMWVKSFSGSYFRFLYSARLAAMVPCVPYSQA
jgi:hypothetical protein